MLDNDAIAATTALLKRLALAHGFSSLAIARADRVDSDATIASERIAEGKFSGLPWLTEQRMQIASDPEKLLQDARSVLTFAINYFDATGELNREHEKGYIARYALGRDYHRVLKRRLAQYMKDVAEEIGQNPSYRVFVDDSPLLERAFARESGLGWIGKNTNLLVPGNGSWVFLAEIITTLELTPDKPVLKTCGSCRRCVDVCPTGAITSDYEVENDLCISYLTIENRGPIPVELRKPIGTWIFGCDLCQEICPVNQLAGDVAFDDFSIRESMNEFDMRDILRMSQSDFDAKFRGTPIMRAKYVGMQRNVCVALGNIGDPSDILLLEKTLGNESALVRSHAVWALVQIGTEESLATLERLRLTEQDPLVIAEMPP